MIKNVYKIYCDIYNVHNIINIYNVNHIDNIDKKYYKDVKILIFNNIFNDSIHKIINMPNIIFIHFGNNFNHPLKWISNLSNLKSIVLGSQFNLYKYSLKPLKNIKNVNILQNYSNLSNCEFFKIIKNNYISNNIKDSKLKIFTYTNFDISYIITDGLNLLFNKILYLYNNIILNIDPYVFRNIFNLPFIKLINKKSDIKFININVVSTYWNQFNTIRKIKLNIYYKISLHITSNHISNEKQYLNRCDGINCKYLKLPYKNLNKNKIENIL